MNSPDTPSTSRTRREREVSRRHRRAPPRTPLGRPRAPSTSAMAGPAARDRPPSGHPTSSTALAPQTRPANTAAPSAPMGGSASATSSTASVKTHAGTELHVIIDRPRIAFWHTRTGELVAEHHVPPPGVKIVGYTKHNANRASEPPMAPEVSPMSCKHHTPTRNKHWLCQSLVAQGGRPDLAHPRWCLLKGCVRQAGWCALPDRVCSIARRTLITSSWSVFVAAASSTSSRIRRITD